MTVTQIRRELREGVISSAGSHIPICESLRERLEFLIRRLSYERQQTTRANQKAVKRQSRRRGARGVQVRPGVG